jgi:serine/threonine protein kinase
LSKRIDTPSASSKQSKLYGIIPYIDPINFRQKKTLNVKSDVYSFGVLLWEMSSGQIPFHTEDNHIALAIEISQGLREKPIPNTPEEYVKLYSSKHNLQYIYLYVFLLKIYFKLFRLLGSRAR